MKNQLTKTSKFLSFVLRHKPDEIGLTLDENGWANINELIEKSVSYGKKINREILEEVVMKNDKKRFVISDDGTSIRANQGHSIAVDLELVPQQPPAILFHGTAERNLELILSSGLKKMQRHHVHLTESTETAKKVGVRYGKPVLLKIKTEPMRRDGFDFYKSENNVWLVDEVPAQYIELD